MSVRRFACGYGVCGVNVRVYRELKREGMNYFPIKGGRKILFLGKCIFQESYNEEIDEWKQMWIQKI